MPVKDAASADAVRDVKILLAAFDKNRDGKLDAAEIEEIKAQYAERHNQLKNSVTREETDSAVEAALDIIAHKYDTDGDGELSLEEITILTNDVHLTETPLRFLGYLGMGARGARYFRALAKGMATARVINGSYALAGCYITGDAIFEMYHARKKTNNECNMLELAHLSAKRVSFNLTSGIVMPFFTLKVVNKVSTRVFQSIFTEHATNMRHARILRLGPSFTALATIPVLPLIWDKPTSYVFDYVFDKIKPEGPLKSAMEERRIIERARVKKQNAAAALK